MVLRVVLHRIRQTYLDILEAMLLAAMTMRRRKKRKYK
jgi:hypothetical protein